MPRLHHCEDGVLVTDKVLEYQQTRNSDCYVSVYNYYENYKDKWYGELKDYLDRDNFNSDFDFKLYRAIDTFDGKQASFLCKKNNWKFSGAFNRWFYAVLRNWKSNVKTSAFRQKKRPSVQCPVCGRYVPRIDEVHLAHYKTKSDLPTALNWKGKIYSVYSVPVELAVCWGDYSPKKLADLREGNFEEYVSEKKRIRWPWYNSDGRRGVVCPFSKKIVPELNTQHLSTLPNELSRYARPITWQEFVEEHPYPTLIQAEVYSLDYHKADDDPSFQENLVVKSKPTSLEQDGRNNTISLEYEHVFHLIETYIEDETNQKLLKLAAAGYSDDDIAIALELTRKEIRTRKSQIRMSSTDLQDKLTDV